MFEVKKDNVYRVVETQEQVKFYLCKGYTLVETQDNNEEDNEEIQSKNIEFNNNLTLENIDSLGYTDLKALAKSYKIKGYSTMPKQELVNSLKGLV